MGTATTPTRLTPPPHTSTPAWPPPDRDPATQAIGMPSQDFRECTTGAESFIGGILGVVQWNLIVEAIQWGDSLSERTVVVTGGQGFLGRYVVDRLRREGRHVIVMDRTDPTAPRRLTSFVAGDVRRWEDVNTAFAAADSWIHLAGVPSTCRCGPVRRPGRRSSPTSVRPGAGAHCPRR